MDFFSDIGKKVSSAAKTVQKRTRESVEITKLNGEMRSLRDERNSLFKSIGETYYESRETDEGRERIEVIVDRLDQIAAREKELQQQIDKLSQQKRCAKCGNVVSVTARFCPACGEKIPEVEKPAPQEPPVVPAPEYCTGCGALRQDYSRFCVVCGKPFDKEEDKSEVEINWPEAAAPADDSDEEPSPEDVSEE